MNEKIVWAILLFFNDGTAGTHAIYATEELAFEATKELDEYEANYVVEKVLMYS